MERANIYPAEHFSKSEYNKVRAVINAMIGLKIWQRGGGGDGGV